MYWCFFACFLNFWITPSLFLTSINVQSCAFSVLLHKLLCLHHLNVLFAQHYLRALIWKRLSTEMPSLHCSPTGVTSNPCRGGEVIEKQLCVCVRVRVCLCVCVYMCLVVFLAAENLQRVVSYRCGGLIALCQLLTLCMISLHAHLNAFAQ